MLPVSGERRRFQRIALTTPVPCTFGELRGFVFDISVDGVLVACAGRIDDLVGSPERPLEFEVDGHRLRFDCTVIHSDHEMRETKTGPRLVTRIGCHFERALDGSDATIRSIIAERVERALDEQKANARGVPAIVPSSIQRGTGTRGYVRYRLRGQSWARERTSSTDQPVDGFTIGADEPEEEVALLCKSYEDSDFEGRKLIRKMAALSISRSEGVPTRRYQP